MMTKRDVLIAICETPGWEPAEDSSSVDKALGDLHDARLIAARAGGGWEATTAALDGYPAFPGTDMADSSPAVRSGWTEQTAPTFLLRGGQRGETKLAEGLIEGGVVLYNTASSNDLTEIEITIRTRTVSDR